MAIRKPLVIGTTGWISELSASDDLSVSGSGANYAGNRVIYSAAYVATNTFTLAAVPTKIYQIWVFNTSVPMNVPIAAYSWTAGTNSVTISDALQSGDTIYFDVELAAVAPTTYVPATIVSSLSATGSVAPTVKTFYKCDATSASFTVNLATAVGREGLVLDFKKIDSSTNTITLDGAGTETIDGGLTVVIQRQYTNLSIISDGLNWYII